MTTSSSVLEQRAREWCRWDPNETTAKRLQDMIDSDADLTEFFGKGRIGFGTAGLRSSMDLGPLHMNDLVILQTAQGIARYCQAQQASTTSQKIVIGYDHRANTDLNLSSLSFALLSALVFEQAGIECILLDGFVATPLLAFATSQLQAAAGIMVTASHNPKQDAGYKVYWNDGCQIRPPVDAGIAQSILENLEPWTDYRALLEQRRQDNHPDDPTLGLSDAALTATVRSQYMNAIRTSGLVSHQVETCTNFNDTTNKPPKFCYTAMHGVGHDFCVQVFKDVFGLPPFDSVPQQQEPDANFSTVVFPNPEEKGALDLAKAQAEQHDCQVVLANDPDADRLAVAELSKDGTWTVFTGDQIGALLGSWMWETIGKTSDKPVSMCASTVSSRLLAEMARVEGFHFEDTLTGFKWIGSRCAELSSNYRSIFGYEEAIGFCCGDVVFDKDGVSAMGVFGELAYHTYNQGLTLSDRLQQLYDKYGEFVSHNGYYFYTDPTVVSRIFDGIRGGGDYPTHVGEHEIASIRDLGEPGYDSSKKDLKPTLPTSASSPMLTLTFTNGCVAQFRASGTEPKFKYYMELKGAPGVKRTVVEEEMTKMASVLLEELLHPAENGLTATRAQAITANL